jgi:hypothetical protein
MGPEGIQAALFSSPGITQRGTADIASLQRLSKHSACFQPFGQTFFMVPGLQGVAGIPGLVAVVIDSPGDPAPGPS